MPALKSLIKKKTRDEAGLFVVEGEKLVSEIPVDYAIKRYAFTQAYAETHDISVYQKKAHCEVIRDQLFNKLADTVTPQGILAVCERMPHKIENILHNNSPILICENVSDPGNVGALIRTAAAAGASGVVLTKGSCDAYSPKAIRSAAGAVLRVPVITDADITEILSTLKKNNIKIYSAHPRGNILPYDLNLRGGFAMLIGNEANGLSQEATEMSDALVRLPMMSDTESLNASVAGSILLYEAVRQRFVCDTIKP